MPKKKTTASVKQADVRCAMTDEQYHELSNELSAIEGMLELVQAPDDADYLGLQIGLRVIGEKLKAAQHLMAAAWDRTVKNQSAAT